MKNSKQEYDNLELERGSKSKNGLEIPQKQRGGEKGGVSNSNKNKSVILLLV